MTNVTVEQLTDFDLDTQSIGAFTQFLITALGLDPECEVSIAVVDPLQMADLHVRWMDLPGATDVLSFPMDELRIPAPGQPSPLGILGDIVLCPEFALAQADQAGRSLDEEMLFLTVHSMLHLLGFDHQTSEEHAAMFALQDELLTAWSTR